MLASASRLGVRLILPFVNTYWYSLWGSTRSYAEWLGGDEDPTAFFTSTAQRDAFKGTISAVLSRVNTVSGIRYADDPVREAYEYLYGGSARTLRSASPPSSTSPYTPPP